MLEGYEQLGERRGYKLYYNASEHEYLAEKDGKLFPLVSVTKVVGSLDKPQLKNWAIKTVLSHIESGFSPGMTAEEFSLLLREASRAPESHSRGATQTGTTVHGWIESFLKGTPEPVPEDKSVLAPIESFLRWWEEKNISPMLSEAPLAHPPMGFAGRADLVTRDRVLIDFKTSARIYPEYALQLGGYALGLEWWQGVMPKGGVIVRIGKDGSLEEKTVDLVRAKEAFLGLLYAYQFVRSFSLDEQRSKDGLEVSR